MQERLAVDVLGCFELFEEPGVFLHVEQVDLGDLFEPVGLALVVREEVVAFGDADLGEGPVAAVVGHDQGGHPGRVGLERQDHHVAHQAEVVAVRAGDAARGGDAGVGHLRRSTPRPLDPGLDLADAGQVLVELVLVAGRELALEVAGVVEDEVEDRLLLFEPSGVVLPSARRPARRRRGVRRPTGGWARGPSAGWASSTTC